jgi:hypothetical protein
MDKNEYYGLYTTTIGATNVSILTEPQSSSRFPPSIFYNGNSYRLTRYYSISTPNQEKNLLDWAAKFNVEAGIQITT